MQGPGTIATKLSSCLQDDVSSRQEKTAKTGRSLRRKSSGARRVAEHAVRGLASLPMNTPQVSCALAQVT
jgi:hypothetical protein